MNPETMTLEQLISVFGEVVGKQMYAQVAASQGGSGSAPFPFLKKVSTHGSELGAFGDFVFGVKTEKDANGNKTVVDKGTNIGSAFEFMLVNVCYRYTLWDEAKQKSQRSNIFTGLDGIKTAVDAYSGKPLPESKEAKVAAKWKLNRINAGLVRKDAKSEWTPVIFETTGALYYSLGELLKGKPMNGLLAGIASLVMKLESKGSTQYSVVDLAKSSFAPLPEKFWSEENKAAIGDITSKMTDYQTSNQYSAPATAQAAPATAPAASEDDLAW